MNKDRGKLVRQKAMGGAELVAAGTALTGGSILMEKMMDSDPKPQLSGHNNVYALDSSPSFFKVESLAGKDELSTIKIVGWVIFGLILLLLIVPVIRAIIRIMKICKQRTSSYNLDTSPEIEPEEKYSIKFTPKLPEIIEDSSSHSKPKDMEEAWAETDKEPDSTNDSPLVTPTHDEIAARNASMNETMKRNVQRFREMTDNNNNSGT